MFYFLLFRLPSRQFLDMVRVPKKKTKASDHIDFESDNEELRGEVDQFHDEKRKLKPNAYMKKKKAVSREILNVEGDLSDKDSVDDGNDSSDFDEAEVNEDGVRVDQWGRERKEFYGTGFVDNDWGGMREEEQDAAELEEEDALIRQKQLSSMGAHHLAEMYDDEPEVEQAEPITKELESVWSLASAKKANKHVVSLIKEYQNRKDMMTVIVEPMTPLIEILPKDSVLRKQLLMVFDVYTSYITSILFYLNLKSESLAKQNATDPLVDEHPVCDEIQRYKKMIGKVDSFLDKNSTALNKMTRLLESGDNFNNIELEKCAKTKRAVQIESPSTALEVPISESLAVADISENGDVSEKRSALSSIVNNENKQMIRKKKRLRHSKVANRHKFKKLEYKVMSQTGKMRQETTKYTGEHRGIRAGVIKSTKLKA